MSAHRKVGGEVFETGRRQKADPAWRHGVWVGKEAISDEHIVLTPKGAVTARSLRRLPRSEQVDAKLLESVRRLPWDRKHGVAPRALPRALAPPLTAPVPVPAEPAGPPAGGGPGGNGGPRAARTQIPSWFMTGRSGRAGRGGRGKGGSSCRSGRCTGGSPSGCGGDRVGMGGMPRVAAHAPTGRSSSAEALASSPTTCTMGGSPGPASGFSGAAARRGLQAPSPCGEGESPGSSVRGTVRMSRPLRSDRVTKRARAGQLDGRRSRVRTSGAALSRNILRRR